VSAKLNVAATPAASWAPTITKGEHAGDSIALDHFLPTAVVPELAARFFNLETPPAHENQAKSAKIGRRELELARRWHREGLLPAAVLKAVETVAGKTTCAFWLGFPNLPI
jgi:hypothetical protein